MEDIQKGADIAKEIGNRGAGAVAEYLRGWIALDQGDYEAAAAASHLTSIRRQPQELGRLMPITPEPASCSLWD